MYRALTKKQKLIVGYLLMIIGAIPIFISISLPGPLFGPIASVWALPLFLFGAPLIPIGLLFVVAANLSG